MITYERWDVVVAPFPFTGVEVRKPRPVLVLSHAGFNREHGHLIGCMITTGARSAWPSDHPISELHSAGLTHASVVRWKVSTLPLATIARRIGVLGAVDRGMVALRLSQALIA